MAGGFLYRAVAEREPDLVPLSLTPPLYYEIEMLWQNSALENETIRAFLEFAQEHGTIEKP